jgi:hypothetical protein
MENTEQPKIVGLINDYGKKRKNAFYKSKEIEDFTTRKAVLELIESTDRVIHHIINESGLEELVEHTKGNHLLTAAKTIKENYKLNRVMGASHQAAFGKYIKQNVALLKKLNEKY